MQNQINPLSESDKEQILLENPMIQNALLQN
jgi:hypothetical protein